ncbi:alpha-1,2-fucosyltransferase [Noviherbaspirillum autotrophicum]|uniref:Alpha-1,2-fucosyltransferase n=1 Tax=Noviherbaspirillum autotrophicum TaxID=709839 RepID=A0A0C2BVW6_9BURK|nr:alpha-1,2-fucosyltransferase [Noviherbaspirillum autotrophicum]KIF82724.1 hypothetical protein TSA66_20870 [Noviherbaspirillum autotrophicum]KIF84174.1 hypothetical protein TSA66_00140 [Noviherbaspirillum autotrophicum]
MIVVRLIGGLGNQMFQYASALALAKRTGSDLILDLSAFKHYSLRDYGLQQWKISARIASSVELRKFPRWGARVARYTQKLGIKTRFYSELGLGFDPAFMKLHAPVYLNGYFQSEKYFLNIRSILLEEFQPSNPLLAQNSRHASDAIESNSVAIHIRRGDYVSNTHNLSIHGVCSLGYYERAINIIRSKIGPANFFVFSDDMEWVRENIRIPDEVVFVEGNNARPEADIHLMSLCKHNICANSSFSWWGAWLNRNPEKIVIAPDPWFVSKALDSNHLIPQDWFQVSS